MARFRQDLLAELGREESAEEEEEGDDDDDNDKVESLMRRSQGEGEDFFAQSFPGAQNGFLFSTS